MTRRYAQMWESGSWHALDIPLGENGWTRPAVCGTDPGAVPEQIWYAITGMRPEPDDACDQCCSCKEAP